MKRALGREIGAGAFAFWRVRFIPRGIMNFLDDVEGESVLVELKIFYERCGALWLRPQKTDGAYCAVCRACLAAMLDPGKSPARKATPCTRSKDGGSGDTR